MINPKDYEFEIEFDGSNKATAKLWLCIDLFDRTIEMPVLIRLSVEPGWELPGCEGKRFISDVTIEAYELEGYKCDPVIAFLNTMTAEECLILEAQLREQLQDHIDAENAPEPTPWRVRHAKRNPAFTHA